MNKIDEIRIAQLDARKIKGASVSLLTTVIGEAVMVGKNAGNREPTDEEVVKVLKKFESGILENISLLESNISTIINASDKLTVSIYELDIIRSFLPQRIADDVVFNDIITVISEKNLAKELKSMGIINKELKTSYGDQFDGKQISEQFKKLMHIMAIRSL